MPKTSFPPFGFDLEQRVNGVTFTDTLQAVIQFDDGRQITWTGELAARLRDAVQGAVREGIANAKQKHETAHDAD